MPEMKAGPELDARLCRLLEPMDTAVEDKAALAWAISSTSPLRFWKFLLGSAHRRPIPVSTDLGAMGRAIKILDDYDLDLTIYHPHDGETYVELQDWRLDSPVHPIYCGSGKDIPHAFSLALVEALEARAEEVHP